MNVSLLSVCSQVHLCERVCDACWSLKKYACTMHHLMYMLYAVCETLCHLHSVICTANAWITVIKCLLH